MGRAASGLAHAAWQRRRELSLIPSMAPCGWRVQVAMADGVSDCYVFPVAKVNWFAIAMAVLGMLPAVLVPIALFSVY
jgi:hypothetical protein